MAITRVGTTKYTPPSGSGGSLTTRQLSLPTGIQDGDTIFVQVQTASGAAANEAALAGVADLIEVDDRVFSGHRHKLYLKQNGLATDSGDPVTITTAAALRCSAIAVVYRGAEVSDALDAILGVNGPASATSQITSPTVQTDSPSSIELQFVGSSGGSAAITSLGIPAGLTRVNEVYDTITTGQVSCSVGENLTPIPAGGNPGGDVWTSTPQGSLLSAITVALKAKVSAAVSRPTSTVTGAGWTPVGNATLHGALADDSDTSYATTGDNPDGTQPLLVANSTQLTSGNFTVKSRLAAPPGSPAIVATCSLYQGTTLIASRSKTVEAVATDWEWTTTAGETAAVTDSTQLRTRYVGVTQA